MRHLKQGIQPHQIAEFCETAITETENQQKQGWINEEQARARILAMDQILLTFFERREANESLDERCC